MADVDISKMSDSEVRDLATKCLEAISLQDRVQVVLVAFPEDSDKSELIQWLQTENEDEEEEEE